MKNQEIKADIQKLKEALNSGGLPENMIAPMKAQLAELQAMLPKTNERAEKARNLAKDKGLRKSKSGRKAKMIDSLKPTAAAKHAVRKGIPTKDAKKHHTAIVRAKKMRRSGADFVAKLPRLEKQAKAEVFTISKEAYKSLEPEIKKDMHRAFYWSVCDKQWLTKPDVTEAKKKQVVADIARFLENPQPQPPKAKKAKSEPKAKAPKADITLVYGTKDDPYGLEQVEKILMEEAKGKKPKAAKAPKKSKSEPKKEKGLLQSIADGIASVFTSSGTPKKKSNAAAKAKKLKVAKAKVAKGNKAKSSSKKPQNTVAPKETEKLGYTIVSSSHKNAMQLQSIGWVLGTPAKEIKAGDTLVWNFGSTEKVVKIKSETAKTITAVIKSKDLSNKEYTGERRLNKDRLVCIAKPMAKKSAFTIKKVAKPATKSRELPPAKMARSKSTFEAKSRGKKAETKESVIFVKLEGDIKKHLSNKKRTLSHGIQDERNIEVFTEQKILKSTQGMVYLVKRDSSLAEKAIKQVELNSHYLNKLSLVNDKYSKEVLEMITVNDGYKKELKAIGFNFKSYGNKQSTIKPLPKSGKAMDCTAINMPVAQIKTDTQRFQNRVDAFSEMSARAVAENYDKNRLDPIVVWKDPANGNTYVLSGHSRLEGMHRRNAKTIPVRYFDGTEAQAIQFARVDANRSAAQESIIEDLQAYKLMRDGNKKLGIEPASKAEIERAFKGKGAKLEAYSYLNPQGLFVDALNAEDKTRYPHLERNAQWIGTFRKENEKMTNTQEEDCFWFFYASVEGSKMGKDEFFALLKKRMSYGRSRLFPECSAEGCKPISDVEQTSRHKEAYMRLNKIDNEIEGVRERLRATSNTQKVITDKERKILVAFGQRLEKEKETILKNIELADSQQSALFGKPKKRKPKKVSIPKKSKEFRELERKVKSIFNRTKKMVNLAAKKVKTKARKFKF